MNRTGMRFFRAMSAPISERIRDVLEAFDISPAQVRPVATGLINRTYRVTDKNGLDYILQAVHGMFPPEVNLDIDMVTRHLQECGLLTPRLLPDRRGMVFYREHGQTWRLFNYVSGNIHLRLQQPEPARAAGAMLGRMHRALAQLDYELQVSRPGTHDIPRHTRHLENTLEDSKGHDRYDAIKPLGTTILTRLEQLQPLPAVAERLVHGDPKISNFIFAGDDRDVKCMVDFDTLARMPVYLELGDALRSWCNPPGEDTIDGYFSMAHCRAALDGYAGHAGASLTREEWQAIPLATLTIYLELAARFCADALNEDYFSWDASRFGSHSEHSETRARGQLSAAISLQNQFGEFDDAVAKAFRG